MTEGHDRLVDRLRSAGRVAVAFSGGFDSVFLLSAAMEASAGDCVAVFVDLPMLSDLQRSDAVAAAEALGAPLIVAEVGWDRLPGILDNDGRRCYICKKAVYAAVREAASGPGCDLCVCGDNADDLRTHRPGRAAAEEMGIMRPLEELGIGRAEIVGKVRSLGLGCRIAKETCLLTRLPADRPVDAGVLKDIASYEEDVRRICGVDQVRFRFGDGRALVQTSSAEVPLLVGRLAELAEHFSDEGICIDIDREGYEGLD